MNDIPSGLHPFYNVRITSVDVGKDGITMNVVSHGNILLKSELKPIEIKTRIIGEDKEKPNADT